MRGHQIRNSESAKSRESVRSPSGFVQSRSQSGVRGGWRQLLDPDQRDALDVEDDDITSVHRLRPSRQAMLPTAPPLLQARPLWQVGLVLESDELARMWVQQGQMNDETTFVWSKYRQTWVPLKSVPELQNAIVRAQSGPIEHSSRVSVVRPAASWFAVELPRFRNESGYLARARNWAEWVRGAVARHLDCGDHAKVVVSRHATWQQRKQAIAAICKHPSTQWLTLGLVAVLGLATLLPRSLTGENRTSLVSHPASGSTPARVKADLIGSAAGETANALANLAPIAIGSLPLVTEPNGRPRAMYAPKATLWTARKAARSVAASNSNNTSPSSAARAPFNVSEARKTLDYAASRIRQCTSGEASGSVIVTFQPSGTVQDLSLSSMAGEVTQTRCILGMFRAARVTPFVGGPVAVRKSFRVGG